jgi:beta-glucuronidase
MDGRWQFITAADRTDRAKLPKRYARTIQVPSAWEQLPGLANYKGQGWFRTTIPAVPGYAVRLEFGGVSHTADVFVDGKHVGHHYDAFTPFAVVMPGLREGEHELVVQVDNTYGEHSALHKDNDYYTYGGITRPVEVQWVQEVFIEQVHATPTRRGQTWGLDVCVRLANWSGKSLKRRVVALIGETVVDLGEVTVAAGKTKKVTGQAKGLDVEPWHPGRPVLYELETLLFDGEDQVDDFRDRVGFRTVEVKGDKLLLNGKSIRLRGYNRHEDHAQFGNALPLSAMVTDLESMADLGCNFVRTSHYPNDMRFLDLCDEMGFYVWEESHARSVSFKHPRFREQIADSTREMIDWHWNRPSIIMWGCLNECDSVSPAGRKEHERVIKLIKSLDRSRPVTFASNKDDDDVCFDLVDIVSWNIYTGWYFRDPAEASDYYDNLHKWLSGSKSGGKGKPVMISEFGAGAIYGSRNPNHAKWTEECQAEVLDKLLATYLNHRNIMGAAIWQFCDCRVDEYIFSHRPRSLNNKGTVDEYRRPKLAYDAVKRRMHEAIERWDG